MTVVNDQYPTGRNPDLPHDAKPGARPIEPVQKLQDNITVQAQVAEEIMRKVAEQIDAIAQHAEEDDRVNYRPGQDAQPMTLEEIEKAFMEGWVHGANKKLEEIAKAKAENGRRSMDEMEERLMAHPEALQPEEQVAPKTFTDRYGVTTHPSGVRTSMQGGYLKLHAQNAPNKQRAPRDQMGNIFKEGADLFYFKNNEYGNSIELTGLVGALAAMTGDVGAARKLVYESLGSGVTAAWKDKVRNKLIDAMVQAGIAIMMLDNDNLIGK
jgi:hypothetical protein